MAEINFPDNAIDGQQFIAGGSLYTYNAAKNLWTGITTKLASDVETGATILSELTDVTLNTNLASGSLFFYNGTSWTDTTKTFDSLFLPSSQQYSVSSVGTIFKITQLGSDLDNPTIIGQSGTTISFKLNSSGHPFRIQQNSLDFNEGLTHVDLTGTVTTGINAQGKETGTLFWEIPYDASGEFTYQCQVHGNQNGKIVVKGIQGQDGLGNYTLTSGVLSIDLETSNIFEIDLTETATSLVFSNKPTAGAAAAYTLIIKPTGAFDIVWGAQVLWPGGTAPTLSSSNTDIISLLTTDGGTTFYGFTAGQDFSAGV